MENLLLSERRPLKFALSSQLRGELVLGYIDLLFCYKGPRTADTRPGENASDAMKTYCRSNEARLTMVEVKGEA
jgi:hypothetical protein